MKVSVIVTFFNQSKKAKECLASLLNQNFEQNDYEIIVVDDGSNDDTGSICKEVIANTDFDNISYIYQTNSGVGAARNKGILLSKGEYLMFVDGDDKVSSTILNDLYNETFLNPGERIIKADAVITDFIAFGIEGLNDKQYHFFKEDFVAKNNDEKKRFYYQLLNKHYGGNEGITAVGVPWGKLYSRDIIVRNKISFPTDLKRMQDNIFNMLFFDEAKIIKYVRKSLYYYRLEHISSFSNLTEDNVLRFLDYRKRFFDQNKKYLDSEMEKYIWNEKIHLFNRCIMDNKYKNSKKISKLVEEPLFNDAIKNINYHGNRTKIIQAKLLSLKMYRLYMLTLCIKKQKNRSWY